MGSYDGVARGRGCPDQLMDAITLTSGQRPLLAGRRARYLERYSSRGRCDGEATYRCAVSLSAGASSARGDELALILAGPLPQSKMRWCRGATSELVARPGRRSATAWKPPPKGSVRTRTERATRRRPDADAAATAGRTTTCKLRGGPRPWTPAAGRRRPPSSWAAALPRAVLFCEASGATPRASPCP